MSSTATTYINSINTNYPIPGVDNDTQGFRDNYSNIKNALTSVASEVNGLQTNTVRLKVSNDFGYDGNIYRAVLDSVGLKVFTVDEDVTEINALNGNYQQVGITGNVSLGVVNWPSAEIEGKVKLEIKNNSTTTNATVTFNNTLGSIKKESSLTFPYTVSSTTSPDPFFFELWTVDAGAKVYVKLLGGPFV